MSASIGNILMVNFTYFYPIVKYEIKFIKTFLYLPSTNVKILIETLVDYGVFECYVQL